MEKHRSLLGEIIGSLVILLVSSGILLYAVLLYRGYYIASRKDPMERFLKQSRLLEQEHYEEIETGERVNFLIYDNEGTQVYSTDRYFSNLIQSREIQFINEYKGQRFAIESLEQGGYLVTRTDRNQELHCMLDDRGVVTSGDEIFHNKMLLSKELDLLTGTIKGKYDVQKCRIITDSGKARMLVLITPSMNIEAYQQIERQANRVWILFGGIVFVLITAEILFIRWRIRKAFCPISQLITAYGQGIIDPSARQGAVKEVSPVVESFLEMQQQLAKKKEEEQNAQKEKQRMIASLCHDIKTPLTALDGYATALMDGTVSEAARDEGLRIIRHRITELTGLTEELSVYTKLEHPEYQLTLEKVDLVEYLRRYFGSIYGMLEKAGMQVTILLPEEAVYVRIDSGMMRRALNNLVSNAMRHCVDGGMLWVVLQRWEQIELFVANDGTPVPEELRQTLFEPFITENVARTQGKGTGLGLTIVKRILELHGGTITLSESPSFGTVEFHIRLPEIK